ncbi:dihydrofolate reductase [Pilobolus umbonatus]|nr:dihydrofolate reductase [Pilobolus umbonatus]
MKHFAIIVAATEELGIGLSHNLPWRIPKDMAFFKHTTTMIPDNSQKQNVVIMGRVTWESIPSKFRPLENRYNIVITRNKHYDLGVAPNTVLADSFESALNQVDSSRHARVFVIGGAQIYTKAIQQSTCSHIVLTRVRSHVECDTFFPAIDESVYRLCSHKELEEYVQQPVLIGIQKYKDLEYEFTLYARK